ncbi:hypothetical protein Tco_0703564 [Tanacetum coccineum]|uniref:Uncharacterized protein n=1 Tax=Tanacetum coccineum TaxID=301880 RepID=A0ABQ4XZ55_9ASTR
MLRDDVARDDRMRIRRNGVPSTITYRSPILFKSMRNIIDQQVINAPLTSLGYASMMARQAGDGPECPPSPTHSPRMSSSYCIHVGAYLFGDDYDLSKSDVLTFNELFYHDTFQFKKSTISS